MTKVLKAGGLWLVVAAVVWLITIWRWQTTADDVGTIDIVLHLLVLPTLLTLALLGVLWGAARLRTQAASPLPGAAAVPTPAGPAPATLHPEEALRQTRLWLLDASVNLRVGTSVEQALSALAEGAERPSLDPVLEDLDGLPAFTARSAAIDEALQWGDDPDEEGPAAWLRPDGTEVPEGVRRALLALAPVLRQLLDRLAQEALGSDAASESARSAVPLASGHDMRAHLSGVAPTESTARRQARESARPGLTVRLLMPGDWSQDDQAFAVQWTKARSGSLLDWAEASGAKAVRWQVSPVESPEAWWDEVDQLMSQWHREARPELMMALALDSAIDADHIDRLQAQGALFTAQHQTGRVPGEGAAGLLLASPGWPRLDAMEPLPAQLLRPLRTRRDKSADATGRASTVALEALLKQATEHTAAQAEHLQLLADSDHRPSRTAELYQALQAVLPEVDPMRQVLRLGDTCGELGMVRALAPLALAWASLREDETQRVALAALLQSPHERVVIALLPHPPAPLGDTAHAV
jgi:hypothetical protein